MRLQWNVNVDVVPTFYIHIRGRSGNGKSGNGGTAVSGHELLDLISRPHRPEPEP